MSVRRQDIVDILMSWKGLKESDGSFKPIIDIYNSIVPLPSGYKLKYTDAWCAGTASAAYQQAGAASIFPCECSCSRMITKAQEMDIWVENDAYIPKIADAVMYDWQDTGIGDNIGSPDHVGIVVSVNKTSKTFVVVEGNMSNAVGTRTKSFNDRYIRGFITPIFDEDFIDTTPSTASIATNTVTTTATTPTVSSAPTVEKVGRGTLSKIAAGAELNLTNVPMYASATTKSVSSYKTGRYFIWSVDTVNGRIRITNALTRVGVKGQVTGWVDVATAIELAAETTPAPVSADTPAYLVNAVYVVQVDDLNVRKGPGTGYEKVGYSGLTANAKKYDTMKTGCLNRGAKVTCLEVKTVGTNVWIRIPSGWIAAYYDKKYYVK